MILDAVVKINNFNKRTIYNAICIKLFYDGAMFYLTASTDDFINITNNET